VRAELTVRIEELVVDAPVDGDDFARAVETDVTRRLAGHGLDAGNPADPLAAEVARQVAASIGKELP
jgi:hypothetical protein